MADTLIADADGVYHPALFNDRLLLDMKGTMSQAELHTLPARLDGGMRNKAARGELRRGRPVVLVWGEADGEMRWHPRRGGHRADHRDLRPLRGHQIGPRDEAVTARPRSAVSAAYLHGADITWAEPSYHAVRKRARPSCLCGCLRVRQDPPATLCRRDAAEAERLQHQAQV
jgi:hypothetical protein